MTELPDGGVQAATEMARIASGPDDIQRRARLLLEALRRSVPFVAASVSLLAPEGPGLIPLARAGDPDGALVAERTGHPKGGAAGEPPGAVDVWLPRGDGSPVGLLSVRVIGCRPVEALRDLLDLVAPVIAYAVDPMRSAMVLASTLADTWAGVALTRTGDVLGLPGLAGHPLLRRWQPVVEVAARRLKDGDAPSAFLPPADGPGRPKITTLSCPTEPPFELIGVVLVSPTHDLYGLTGRELEILGLMVEGCSNQRMADALYITERTVAAHVQHILAKLGVPTRTLAAVRAQRMGLYVPPALTAARKVGPGPCL